MGYETEYWREPKAADNETVIASEHGRIAFNIDYRSHWFMLVKQSEWRYAIRVKHGGGEECVSMPTVNFKFTAEAVCALPSDQRYLMLHHLYDIARDAKREAEDATAAKYRRAFAEGTLKKRKMPNQGRVKVWIESAPIFGQPTAEVRVNG